MFPLKDNIPTRRFPVVTVSIIAINIVMFFLFQEARWDGGGFSVDEENVIDYAAIPYELTNPGDHCEAAGSQVACEGQPGVTGEAEPQPPTILTVFTAMFMHGGFLHIAGNMLFLWIFGNNIEDSMGRVRFLIFYLLAGIAAMAAQTLFNPDSAVPTLGASGAVAGVLGAYALIYPRARVVTVVFIILFFTVLELPALLVLGAWLVLQLLPAVAEASQPAAGGGVAYWAHIGGFLCGLALIKLFANKVDEDYDRHGRIPVY